MITIFTWGYWGWGSTTKALVRAVDATERKRGFRPPIFVDIRYSRAVRAKGFSGPAFEKLLGASRHRHMKDLGNRSIATHENRVHIEDPSAAKLLLDLAQNAHQEKRRVIFFCACKDVRGCHRRKVAKLVLKEARKAGRRVEIVEWPGGMPQQKTLRLGAGNAIKSGGTLPLPKSTKLGELACLPWGSVVGVKSAHLSSLFLSGPAQYRHGWRLPLLEAGRPNETGPQLQKRRSQQFRKRYGFGPLRSWE